MATVAKSHAEQISQDESDSNTTGHKRKREADSDALDQSSAAPRIVQIQRDILDVLKSRDTVPSFLNHALCGATSGEHDSKKTKLSSPRLTPSTIFDKLRTGSYTSLQHVKTDAAFVCERLVSDIRSGARERESTSKRPTVEELKQIQRVQLLESMVKEMVDKEDSMIEAQTRVAAKTREAEKQADTQSAADPHLKDDHRSAGTVLTLFGNAPTPKQLFSSTQILANDSSRFRVKSGLPVEEMSLPNGISATQVVSVPSDSVKGFPTFEDTFSPAWSLPALHPPKAPKRSSVRDHSVTWEFKDSIQRNKKGGHTVQPQTVGTWLGYGGVDENDSNSTKEKRKERTRALSTSGEAVDRPAQSILNEALAKEEEALFRRAYSSFAPTFDNSNATVAEETKNMIWWHKIGKRRFNSTLAVDPALLDGSDLTSSPSDTTQDSPSKDDDFSRILQDLEDYDDTNIYPKQAKSRTDVEQVLQDISELLETLASHQRIRNAALVSAGNAARPPISPAPSVTSKISKPDEPSEDEYSTYNNLRRELVYLLLKLPPYAVAKIDGNQLADLGVTKFITYQTKDIRGTLEEDSVFRQAKLQAAATATSIANLARPNSSAGQHYNTTAQRTPAIGQAANTRYGQQYGARTPVNTSQFQRQSSNSQQYGTPTSTASRLKYGQTSQWPRTNGQPGYGQNGHQHYQQRPQQGSSAFGNYNQQFQQAQGRFSSQYQPQRPISQQATGGAGGYQADVNAQQQAYNRTASPVKAAGYPAVTMAPTPTQPRPIYPVQQPGSGKATPTGYPPQPHTPVNGYPAPRQAQGIAPRPASSTPQPPPPQPLAQTNGTT